jgi:pimeloyl-ACP methyl ester carboxylesterase
VGHASQKKYNTWDCPAILRAKLATLLRKFRQRQEPGSEADRKAYTAIYSRPGRMRAGWAYFVSFQQVAKDVAQLSQAKLTMPVLVMGGEKALGQVLAQQMRLVASDVTVVMLKDSGHRVLEERPKETTDALLKFL